MSKRLRIVIAAAAPILTASVLVLKDFILGLKRYLPDCTFHTVTGYLCPGCGNTRSLTYLLNGDILSALRCNVTIPFLGMLLVLLSILKMQPRSQERTLNSCRGTALCGQALLYCFSRILPQGTSFRTLHRYKRTSKRKSLIMGF